MFLLPGQLACQHLLPSHSINLDPDGSKFPVALLFKNWDYLMGNYRIQIAKIQRFLEPMDRLRAEMVHACHCLGAEIQLLLDLVLESHGYQFHRVGKI